MYAFLYFTKVEYSPIGKIATLTGPEHPRDPARAVTTLL